MGIKEIVGLGNGEHRPELRAVPDPDTTDNSDTALVPVEVAGDQPADGQDQPSTELEPKVFDGEFAEDQERTEENHGPAGEPEDEDQAVAEVAVDPPAGRDRVDLLARARGDETR